MSSILSAFLSQTAPAAPDPGSAAPSGPFGGGMQTILMFAAMIAAFYFIVFRPQGKERKKMQEMLSKLQKGHDVLTQSGIFGKVVQVEDQYVILDIGGGTKVKMVRAYIARNVTLEEEDKAARAAKAGARK